METMPNSEQKKVSISDANLCDKSKLDFMCVWFCLEFEWLFAHSNAVENLQLLSECDRVRFEQLFANQMAVR